MHTITGSHLLSTNGEDIGEITDVVGSNGPDVTPTWLAVKTGWFSQRLVPFAIVVEDGDAFRTDCTPDDVKQAPKVPVHFEPSGHDLDELCDYYRASLV
ncbi:MAG: PRC-barrel domain-containing protein [Acidimicrobiales bacterium]|nr:PRC-barrel domain-containing protein [Acidimicrobiales bacterium]